MLSNTELKYGERTIEVMIEGTEAQDFRLVCIYGKEYLLIEYYINYLRSVRKLSDSSVKHYVGGLSTITKMLIAKGKVHNSIYEINNLQDLLIAGEFLKNDVDFIEKSLNAIIEQFESLKQELVFLLSENEEA